MAKRLLLISLILFLLVLVGCSSYLYFLDKIYPGVSVSTLSLTSSNKDQAKNQIIALVSKRTASPLEFKYQDQSFQIDLSSLAQMDYSSAVDGAFSFGHQKIYLSPVDLPLLSELPPGILTQITMISQSLNRAPIDSQLSVSSDQISASPSQNGISLDEEKLKQEILVYLNTGQLPAQELPVKETLPKLSYNQALALKKELDTLKLSPINLNFKDKSYSLDLETLLTMMDPSNTKSVVFSGTILGQDTTISDIKIDDQTYSDVKLSLNSQKLSDYLGGLSKDINRDVLEPLFSFDPAANSGRGKVTNFQPPQEGYKLDTTKAAEDINERLVSSDFSPLSLPVEIIEPKNQLTNELGIKELIGEGVSHFAHSIPNRIFNIELAASRINGTLIPPGGIFSYNDTVGEVSAATGFKQGYVIKSGKTVLDDGGGVCQDSTTLFRAALNAGLPIVSRTAHAYRVGYYEQDSPPGLDATVFAPSVDFRFRNDTPASILVQATTYNDDTLIIDLYGTSDGRISKVTTPVILSTTPALPDVHQDDPTLAKGETKQVDFAASGANVVFSRTVSRDNQTLIQETFHSNYQPWANVFLVGTGG